MLKLIPPNSENYHNFKCGEIYCLTASKYTVNCCLCGNQVTFEDFPNHFVNEHLSKNGGNCATTDELFASESISNERDTKSSLDEENLLHDPITRQEEKEYPEENPISIQLNDLLDNACPGNKSDFDDETVNDDERISDDEESDENGTCKGKKNNDAERPFPCTKCDRAYKSKRGLWNHLRINHNPNRPKKTPKKCYQCEECGESFRSERHLKGHKWKHTGISCDVCGKTFTQTGNLMRHKIRHTGIKAHRCQECDFSFFTEKELRSHMIKHTQKFPIICEICGRRCRDHGVLTAHMRRHTGERPAKCQDCGKSFFSFHDLNVHAVTHTTERPFSCEICGSTFQRKKALRVHKKLHSTDRKHVCKICGKAFTQSSGLNAHMRRHETCTQASKGSDMKEQEKESSSDIVNSTNWSNE